MHCGLCRKHTLGCEVDFAFIVPDRPTRPSPRARFRPGSGRPTDPLRACRRGYWGVGGGRPTDRPREAVGGDAGSGRPDRPTVSGRPPRRSRVRSPELGMNIDIRPAAAVESDGPDRPFHFQTDRQTVRSSIERFGKKTLADRPTRPDPGRPRTARRGGPTDRPVPTPTDPPTASRGAGRPTDPSGFWAATRDENAKSTSHPLSDLCYVMLSDS